MSGGSADHVVGKLYGELDGRRNVFGGVDKARSKPRDSAEIEIKLPAR
jgi:hypothetical protein